MEIKSIKLQNFKGFKDATLKLKPLTVILGPNSAGKSSFGQALVALSKSNAENDILSLASDARSSIDFGSYYDLIHHGSEGELVTIELELSTSVVRLGFSPSNIKAGIKDLDISKMEILEHGRLAVSGEPSVGSVSQTITTTRFNSMAFYNIEQLNRDTNREWTVVKCERRDDAVGEETKSRKVNLNFHGVTIDTVSHVAGTAVNINDVAPKSKIRLNYLASLLRGVSYLRPDREPPARKRTVPVGSIANIGDWGDGTDWYIYQNKKLAVDTFFFPEPSTDREESKSRLVEYLNTKTDRKLLPTALTMWLNKLGLASFIDTKLIEGERSIQTVATPKGQVNPRPLTDLGFGVSQVLPILVKGLTLKKGDILVVEQPEAQLHPRPQAELADFFCAMVKCGRNVIVETHSVELFHRLRLRASMDDDLADKIGIHFLHEPEAGVCGDPVPISLQEEDELEWPKGFLPEGIENELEILAVRLARRESKN